MSDSDKASVAKKILQSVEDFATIVKGEIDIAKKSLTNSVKKIGSGIGFIITAFLLMNVSLLFLLIRSFRKVRGIGDASRIGSETTRYLAENIKKPEKDSGWNSLN